MGPRRRPSSPVAPRLPQPCARVRRSSKARTFKLVDFGPEMNKTRKIVRSRTTAETSRVLRRSSGTGAIVYAPDLRFTGQGRQRGHPVDVAVMPLFRRQGCPSSASCARLESRHLPAHAGDASADQGLAADEPERETHQDRREGSQPRPLCRLPDGRGRHLILVRHHIDVRRRSSRRSTRGRAEKPPPIPARDACRRIRA